MKKFNNVKKNLIDWNTLLNLIIQNNERSFIIHKFLKFTINKAIKYTPKHIRQVADQKYIKLELCKRKLYIIQLISLVN